MTNRVSFTPIVYIFNSLMQMYFVWDMFCLLSWLLSMYKQTARSWCDINQSIRVNRLQFFSCFASTSFYIPSCVYCYSNHE